MAARSPVFELNVRLVPVLTGKLPVAPVANNTLHVVSVDSSSRETFVALVAVPAVSELPITSPVTLPNKLEAVMIPVKNPLDAVTNPTVPTPDTFKFLPVISSYAMSPEILTSPFTVRPPTVAIPVANTSPSGLMVTPDPMRTSF